MKHILLDNNWNFTEIRKDNKSSKSIMWIPTSFVITHIIGLPAGVGSALNEAIAFAMEDFLLDDIEEYEFIHKTISKDKNKATYLVACINKTLLEKIKSYSKEKDFNIQAICPDYFLLPKHKNSSTIFFDNDKLLFYLDNGLGFSLPKLDKNYDVELIQTVISTKTEYEDSQNNNKNTSSNIENSELTTTINDTTTDDLMFNALGKDTIESIPKETFYLFSLDNSFVPAQWQNKTKYVNSFTDIIDWKNLTVPKINFFKSEFSWSFLNILRKNKSTAGTNEIAVYSYMLVFLLIVYFSISSFTYFRQQENSSELVLEIFSQMFPPDQIGIADRLLEKQVLNLKDWQQKRDQGVWLKIKEIATIMRSCPSCIVLSLEYLPTGSSITLSTLSESFIIEIETRTNPDNIETISNTNDTFIYKVEYMSDIIVSEQVEPNIEEPATTNSSIFATTTN